MTGKLSLKLALTFSVSLLLSSTALSQVYKTVDENGKVTFTDSPEESAQPVELSEPNTVEHVDVKPRPAAPNPTTSKSYHLSISSPASGTSISGLTPLTVTGKLTPALKPRHQIQLLVDGGNYGFSRSNSFSVSGLSRGEHNLQLLVVDSNGTTLSSSTTVTIAVTRPNNLINVGNEKARHPEHLPSRPGTNHPSRPNPPLRPNINSH